MDMLWCPRDFGCALPLMEVGQHPGKATGPADHIRKLLGKLEGSFRSVAIEVSSRNVRSDKNANQHFRVLVPSNLGSGMVLSVACKLFRQIFSTGARSIETGIPVFCRRTEIRRMNSSIVTSMMPSSQMQATGPLSFLSIQ